MELFSKELEELRRIQGQNTETLTNLQGELDILTRELFTGLCFPSFFANFFVEEQTLKQLLETKEKHHAHYCEQIVASYKLKTEEIAYTKNIDEALDNIVALQGRIYVLEALQKQQT
jgi:hypothetical protein